MADLKDKLDLIMKEHPNISLVNAIYGVLQDSIISLQIFPNTKLSLAKLSDELDVSMTSVRGAVMCLVDNGLVTAQKYRKAVVSAFNKTDYQNFVFAKLKIQ